jgi:signal transduction histidine kinase
LKGGTIYADLGLNISSEGTEDRALISIMDITDRKKAKEREDFLRTLLRHDLSNKIHLVQGYLKLLKDTGLSEDEKKIIKRVNDASKECQQLVEKVWMLSEIDQKEEQTEVNLDVHIQNVITKNQGKAKENQIEIEYEVVPYDVTGGPLLEELFHNLIENAIKHSKCSKIKISGYKDEENIKVIVEDDGEGIEKEYAEKLLDKSFKGKSKGIGTYIIKRIAENYGGSVSIKDSKLGGARFVITLKQT